MGAKSDALQAEFDAFKVQVREEAIRAAQEEGWCDSGLNSALRRLGLREKAEPQPVEVRITRQPEANTYTVYVEADSADEARRLLTEDQVRLRREVQHQIGFRHGNVVEMAVVQPPAPVEPGAVPAVGNAAPAEGDWYRRAQVSGDREQCRELDPDRRWYCTRPVGHAVSEESPHVATSASEGVRAVWTEGGTPRSAWLDDTDDDTDD